jgi:hypothetical protein
MKMEYEWADFDYAGDWKATALAFINARAADGFEVHNIIAHVPQGGFSVLMSRLKDEPVNKWPLPEPEPEPEPEPDDELTPTPAHKAEPKPKRPPRRKR